MDFKIAVLPGDGIGPEVTTEAVKILDAIADRYNHSFQTTHGLVGGIAIDSTGTALPEKTLEIAQESDAILFGAVGGPKWDDPRASVRPEDGILSIRKRLGLFANLRPVQVHPDLTDASPLKPNILNEVDFVVVRELTGGLYFGSPKTRWSTPEGRFGVDTMAYSELEIERVLRLGFELAALRKMKLTSVDKANVLETSRLWREIAIELAKDYPNVELQHMLVDTAAMELVRAPSQFDVIVTENTFGDILTDEAAVLAGSMGMLPSASLAGVIGSKALGLYEPIHGTAPTIAGKSLANPIAAILSAALLLRYSLGLHKEANAIEQAVASALSAGHRSPDIAKQGEVPLTTGQMGDCIVGLLE